MTESISIAEFKVLDPNKIFTSCIKVKVDSVTTPKPGETNGRKWEMQSITISDDTGELKLTLFNGRVGKLTRGKYYLLCDLGVDSYQGNTTAKVVPATSIREVAGPSDEAIKQRQEQTDQETKEEEKSIKESQDKLFNQSNLEQIDDNLDKLMVIESMVRNKLPSKGCTSYDAKVGMYMKFIWDSYNGVNN